VAGKPLLLRRARGYVPGPLPSPCDVTGIVGCGGVLKSTVAAGRGASCYVSQYVGNADNAETLAQLDEIKGHMLNVLGIRPSLFVTDLHPGAVSSRIADASVPLMRVQHHHAHAAACMAENNLAGPAVCVVYDGTGYGADGTIWGGEIFAGDYGGFERAGHLVPMPLPGGEAGIRNPWRMAMGVLYPVMGDWVMRLFPQIPAADRAAVFEMLSHNVSCVLTSGMGRLFDAMSAILGICVRMNYEGQPAIMLEAVADKSVQSAYETRLDKNPVSGGVLINGPGIVYEALDDFVSGTPASVVAARFHETIAKATAIAAESVAGTRNTQLVCLSGGCFQNALLLERTVFHVRKAGLQPIVHRLMPPNDESISYGQVVIAGMRRQGQ
jgi:hydrogenase maturation protein HypF